MHTTPQITFTIRGRWWRIFSSVTDWRDLRLRSSRFYGYRLIALRLWRSRIIGIQTRREQA